jgi:hypothetical protein
MVTPLVPQPGHMFGRIVNRQNNTPHGFQNRTKPATAVSPGGQRVALDLHVQEVLNGDAEHGRPEKPQADGRRHVGPDDVLARAHAKAGEDDARPQDLAERQRLGHVPVRHRRQVAIANRIEKRCGCITRPDGRVAHGDLQYPLDQALARETWGLVGNVAGRKTVFATCDARHHAGWRPPDFVRVE